jgi:putative acetyltransferase
MIEIRPATRADYDEIADVMYDAVRRGRSKYSEAQRRAWVPERRSGAAWTERLDSQSIFVASELSQLVGFMSLAEHGYIDFAYIRPSAQGSGLFRKLYVATEQLAQRKGAQRLWVHASLMAQPAFAAMGFDVVAKQAVVIGDQTFERFEMEKRISVA